MQESGDNIKVVEGAFAILQKLFEHERMGVRELGKSLGLPKTTIFRIIKTLVSLNIVEQDSDEQYRLGLALSQYGTRVNNSLNVVTISSPIMKSLARELGETINLGILYEDQILIVHSEFGEPYTLQLILKPVTPLYCSSIGKLFLADMDEAARDRYFRQELPKRTVNTIVTLKQFEAERKDIVAGGNAHDREEYEYGLSCVSAPIFGPDGKIAAALSVSGPTTRLSFKGIQRIEGLLRKAAKNVSKDAR
jgi:Transcriptional regulator